MKCPKCGRLWDVSNRVTSTTYVCPYCGEIFDGNGQIKKNLGLVIRNIINDFGENVIDDTSRLNALLMDYVPEMAKERKLVINALKEGLSTQLKRGIEEEKEDVEIVVRRCSAMLVSEMWVTENAARYAVKVVAESLGYMSSEADSNSLQTPENDAISGNDKQLIKGKVSFGSVVRKEKLLGYTSIGYKAFACNDQLIEIDIPDNVERIYPKAFQNCIRLRKVSIGSKLEAIGRGAFDGCIQLDTIQIDNNTNYIVSNGLLIDRNRRMLIRCVDRLGTTLSITNGVKRICKNAFEKTDTEHIYISGTVSEIEEDAFAYTMCLQEIKVEPSNRNFRSIDGVLHSRNGKVLVRYPQGKSESFYYLEDEVEKVGKKAFSCAIKLCSITFAGNLKEIAGNAFEYCSGLENLLLPRSVEIIGERAFQYCNKLSSIMLPNGIIRIDDCAFLGCELLKTVSIPRSVKEIGNMAFAGCKSLSKVVIQDNVSFIGDRAFYDCPNIEISVKGNDYVFTYCKMHGLKVSKA